MIETDGQSEQGELNRTRLAAVAVATGGVLTGFVVIAWALARYAELGRTGAFSLTSFLETTALMFAGTAVGLLLWGVAEGLRKLDAVLALLRERGTEAVAEPAAYRGPARPDLSRQAVDEVKAALGQLVAVTREVRDISMLSESERTQRLTVQGAALVEKLQQEIPALLQGHQWVEARTRVQRARERFPAFSEWDALEQQIEGLRAKVEARDVETARRQVDDLTALGALDRAVSVIRELLERHPNSDAARELARRVTVQRDKVDAEARARLMSQAQESVNRREWTNALALSNEMIRRYPRSVEAEALRQQLPTLTENAEIQTRQKMESEFRGLMTQRRFEAALLLAHELIERYPNSPQAEVLREQLPRLEEKVSVR